jgi:opacity protein-like surface antigen
MRRPLMAIAVMLGVSCAVSGQQSVPTTTQSPVNTQSKNSFNAAQAFEATSGGNVNLLSASGSSPLDAVSFAPPSAALVAAPENAEAFPAGPAALPASPAAKPRFVFGDRDDYRWQLGFGVELFRFQSDLINATLVGTNTTLTYFTNSWLGLEGSLGTGFAPQIYDREHVKLFTGSAGLRIGTRRARFEPWAHFQVGGAHLQPQTAGNSRNAFMFLGGLGLDFRVNSRLSLRASADYVRTLFFSQDQNNVQGTLGAVIHF